MAALVLAIISAATSVGAPVKSVYTPTDGRACVVVDESPGMYARARCPGTGGWQVEVEDADLRMSLTLVAPDGHVTPLSFATISSQFSELGSRIEWRVDSRGRPRSLIVRFTYAVDGSDPTHTYSLLLVIAVAGRTGCLIAKVPPGPTQNTTARKRADTGAANDCTILSA